MIVPKQVKPKIPKTRLPLYSSLQSYAKLFYKYIGYYVFYSNSNNNMWNIRKQAMGYVMILKRKQSRKVKAKGCVEGNCHRKFNHELESRSHIVTSCLHIDFYVMNTFDYNYKLRSIIGREDDFITNKWKWFDTQVRDTSLWSWMISQSLVDYTNMERTIGHLLDELYAASVSMKDSIGSITSYFYTSMVIHPSSNDHLQKYNIIHGNMLSSSLFWNIVFANPTHVFLILSSRKSTNFPLI